MQLRIVWLCSLLTAAALIGAAQTRKPGGLVVHEWGTFLAMNGSDGVSLDGMYHEEHALPAFVHARSRDQLHLPTVGLKGETPVIYFYTDRPQNVAVRVRFPQGIWTQWYPGAEFAGPELAGVPSPPSVRNGHLFWRAEIIQINSNSSHTALPATETDALWNYARDVDAATVRTEDPQRGTETEKFLFYRGLGQAALPLQASTADGGTVALSASEQHTMRHLFVLRVEKGKGAYRYLSSLAPGERKTGVIPSMEAARPLPEFTQHIADDLAARLTESGLYPKEARAMVNTWKSSYFGSDGIRVLFALPQAWTDAFIPLSIEPKPAQIVRVMVGRLELLTTEREKRSEQAVRDLASVDAGTREKAFDYLRAQGRYVEPILRRTLRTTQDAQVRTLCKRLVLTDFVTELRAAIHSATNGAKIEEPTPFVHARLASLLHEIGLDGEAQQEAETAHAALDRMELPPMGNFQVRPYLRAYARTAEATGDDRDAAARYATFVRFGSQMKTCGGGFCHHNEGPRNMAFFRDWWVGRKYAHYVARTGQTDRAIETHEAALLNRPSDTAAQMMLAYLYELKGEAARAAKMWAMVEGRPERAASRTTARRP